MFIDFMPQNMQLLPILGHKVSEVKKITIQLNLLFSAVPDKFILHYLGNCGILILAKSK